MAIHETVLGRERRQRLKEFATPVDTPAHHVRHRVRADKQRFTTC